MTLKMFSVKSLRLHINSSCSTIKDKRSYYYVFFVFLILYKTNDACKCYAKLIYISIETITAGLFEFSAITKCYTIFTTNPYDKDGLSLYVRGHLNNAGLN